MDEYVGESVERLEVALAHAVADEAVLQFFSLDLLLSALPHELRGEVREAFRPFLPLTAGAVFLAHVRMPQQDGLWGVFRCTGGHAGGVIICCDEARYGKAIHRIKAALETLQEQVWLN